MATKPDSRTSLRSIARRLELSVARLPSAEQRCLGEFGHRRRVQKMANELGYNSNIGRRVTTSIGLVYANDFPSANSTPGYSPA